MKMIYSKMKALYSFQSLWFVLIFICIFFYLGMHNELFFGPKGIHFLRQTDGLSFASQYFNNNFDFFNPKLYNLKNIDARASCEFPITYYITSLLYGVFGKHPAILKLIHLFIIYVGIYYVFKLSNLILNHALTSVLIALFLFTSTVFNYYSFNYLPDAPALGFTFIGTYFMFKYLIENKNKSLIVGFLFFSLAGLIKITYSIYPISFIVFALISLLYKKRNLISVIQSKKILFYGGITILLILSWTIYMLYYNSLYNSSSFNTRPLPIWGMSKSEILHVWDIMVNYWDSEYIAYPSLFIIIFLFLLQLVFLKRSHPFLLIITLISLIGFLCYFLLFYKQFKDHDYYMLVIFPIITFIIINGAKVLFHILKNYNINFKRIAIFCFFLIVIYGIRYSGLQMERRFNLQPDTISETSLKVESKISKINRLNIPTDAKFLVVPDPTPNGSLLFLNKLGWNIENINNFHLDTVLFYKNIGADYLLLYDQKNLINDSNVGKVIFNEDGVKIIKI